MLTTIKDKAKSIFSANAENNHHNGMDIDSEQKIIKVDLNDYGLLKAGATGADPAALKNYLEDIHNGFIVDVNENEDEQRKEQEKRQAEIDKFLVDKSNKEAELRKIKEVEIPAVTEQISGLRKQASDLDIERVRRTGETRRSNFNLNLYWPVFVMATVFLYGFYLSAFHTAFFKDMAKELTQANANNISELLNTVFNKQAFLEFNLHWFAPIIFFVFSMVLHIVFDTDKRQRPYLLAGMLILILIADCLLAYFIEYNSHLIQMLNGMTDETSAFYKSPRFYLVLFLGFFTCLGWSLILYAIKGEYLKEDLDEVVRLQKQQLRQKENELLTKVEEHQKHVINIETQIQQAQQLIERKTKQLNNLVYSVSDLEKRITAFYGGWLTFITNLKNNMGLITSNEAIMNEFRNLYLKKSETQFQNTIN
jgi:hypothetical protein